MSATRVWAQKRTNVLIAGKHDLFLSAVRALLESDPHVHVIGEAGSDVETLSHLAELKPDVLLIDSGMNPAVFQSVRKTIPTMRLIAIADNGRPVRSIHVDAVIPLTADLRNLLDAVKLDRPVRETGESAPKPQAPFGLTPREFDVLRDICDGRTNQEIAGHLSISLSTVKHYVAKIFDKLGVFNRVELVLFAVGHHLNG